LVAFSRHPAPGLSGAILAAGRGERLRRVPGMLPKPLIDIGGQSLLLRQIGMLIGVGARPIHVIINHETERLISQLRLQLPAHIDLLVRDTPNSMESLLGLGERIAPGGFVLMTVDAVLPSAEIRNFVTHATEIIANPDLRLDGVLGVVKWRGDRTPLFAQVAADGLIESLGGQQSPMVTAGIYVLSTSIFFHAAEARRRGLDAMRRFLAMLVESSMRFIALEVQQAIDVDEPSDLRAVHDMLGRSSE
jgi:choline kinase